MNRRILGGLTTVAIVVTLLAQVVFGQAVHAAAGGATGNLEVRGVGSIEVRPDQATIIVRLYALEDTAAEAQRVNAGNMAALEAVLNELGIDDDALRTRSITLREDWEYIQNQREFRGYLAEHHLAITVDDLSQVGLVLDQIVDVSQVTVQGVEFGLRDRREAEGLALREAYAHAMSRAEVLAEMAGIKLGLPSAIVDESSVVAAMPVAMDQAFLRAAVAYEAAPTSVHPGMINVEARVRLEFTY